MIAIIVAADTQGAIGLKNRIPWHIKSDLIRLAKFTRGHTVILGRKSYDSMVAYYDKRGKHMPGGHYIVITHDTTHKTGHDEAHVAHSIQEAVDAAKNIGSDVFVLGGGSIFSEILPFVDRIYLTEVQANINGDAHFPAIDQAQWREVSREHHSKDDRDEYDTDFVILERS